MAAPESNSTYKGSEFRKSVPVTTTPKVAASLLLITLALLGAELTGGGP